MKLFRKPLWIILTAASLTVALSAIVGVSVGVKSYNNSYYSYLNKSPELHTISGTSPISAEEFKTIVTDLKLKSNFSKMSAKTALDLAKSKLYQLDLTSAYDFDKLKAKNFQVSFDFENATVEGNVIKNVVVFAKSDKDQTTYSKQVELKGFATTDETSGDLDKFQIDQSKSFVDLSRSNLSLSEFKNSLQDNFKKQSSTLNAFSKLEKALILTNASLSLYNSLEEPVFLDENYKLEPVLDSAKKELSLVEKQGKLLLELNLVGEKNKKSLKLQLEIRGLVSNQEISNALKTWFEENLENKVEMKEELQKALIEDKTSLVDHLYNSKTGTKTSAVIKKDFNQLFDLSQTQFDAETKFGDYKLNVQPKIADATKVSTEDKTKLVSSKKVRFEFVTTVSRNNAEVAKNLSVFVDLNVDLNKYEAALSSIFGSVNSVKEFSIANQNDARTLSSNEIKETIDQLFELAKTSSNLEDPTDDVISKVYLLDHGKYPTSEDEKTKAKEDLKKAIEDAKQKANPGTKTAPATPPKPANPAPAPTPGKPGSSTQNSTTPQTDSSSKNVSVSTFADQSSEFVNDATQQNSQTAVAAEQKIGTNVWTTLNAATIYDLKDVEPKYQIDTKDDKVVFDFKLVSKEDVSNILASSKVVINNVINSEKSAYDVIKKYNPKLFLDPSGLKVDSSSKSSSPVQISDPLNKKLLFKSEGAKKTEDGLELTKPLVWENKEIKTVSTGKDNSESEDTKKPESRVDSGAVYLAFRAKNISDGKQHYLLADKEGKGIFVQKIKTNSQKDVYVVGMDYKQFQEYAHYKSHVWGSDKRESLISLFSPGNSSPKMVNQQQILVISGYPRGKETKTTEVSSIPVTQTVSASSSTGSITGKFHISSRDKTKNPGFEITTSGTWGNTDTKPDSKPKLHDHANDVYYKQSFFSPTGKESKYPNLLEEETDLLLEIIKTPYSIRTTLYSSNTDDPKNYKEVGTVLYNFDISGNWNPFPNFFNLDWHQIGPVVKKPEAAKPTATKTEATKTEAAKPVATKVETQPAKITLKGLAVFDDPEITYRKSASIRNEITDAFIDSYIKK
ncbi:Uncharacterised protein [Mesomycoplasma dispar]|uniref:Uncharacterized protein n=1 Tax=Mesomycoplasma dispar TaxID=86660 RepID=A0AAJ5TCW1_9BACT|nr:P110/LppT family adhesin N-terminal domain [Mesomycoplasma dispar]AJR12380.1 hypothetical protein MDIS_03320 [Mesomycoplasma dispar]VEU62272.1 Uncharacterised protein [Mesomycoplasma dispar]